jgi:hypothetical protein
MKAPFFFIAYFLVFGVALVAPEDVFLPDAAFFAVALVAIFIKCI